MSVPTRTLIVISLTFLALQTQVYFSSQWFLFQDAIIAKEESATRNVTRLLTTLNNQIAAMHATVSGWAHWDDSHEFIRSGNTSSIDSYLTNNSAFTNIWVELMLLVNNSGQTYLSNLVDLESGGAIPTPNTVLSERQVGRRLLSHTECTDKPAGIISLVHGPLLIAPQRIVASLGEGLVRGIPIMAWRLNEAEDDLI